MPTGFTGIGRPPPDDAQASAPTAPPGPDGPDPFADLLGTGAPARPAGEDTPAQAFEKNNGTDPFKDILTTPEEQTSNPTSFVHGMELGALPGAGSLAAAGYGAETGAEIGSVAGPWGSLIGGFTGAVAGGILGARAVSDVQNWVLHQLPESWVDALGVSDRQQQLDQEYHPTASFLGGLVPYALAMRPGSFSMAAKALPENATAWQKIVANPLTARLFGGAMMGGMETANEVQGGNSVDWAHVAIATGFGLIFNEPMGLGKAIVGAGSSAAHVGGDALRWLGGEPFRANVPTEPLATRVEDLPGYKPPTAPVGEEPLTVAQAADAKVMGAGITEDVFMGSHAQSPESAMTAQDAARTESALLRPQPIEPDVHAVARRMEPETFQAYDALSAQREALRSQLASLANPPAEAVQTATERLAGLQARLDEHVAGRGGYTGGHEARALRAQVRDAQAEVNELTERQKAFSTGQGADTPEMTALRQKVMETDVAMRDMVPQLSAAYRRAADAANTETVDHEALDRTEAATQAIREAAAPTPQAGAAQPKEAPIVQFRRDAEEINRNLPPPAAGMTRLWRGNRPGETGQNPQFTNDLPGLALPFRKAYGGDLSYVDIPTEQASKYVNTAGAATNAEFTLPKELAAQAKRADHAPGSIQTQVDAIAKTVNDQLIAAGRPPEEARANAELIAQRYKTRAARMQGAIGGPLALFESEGPIIRAGGKAPLMPTVAEPNLPSRTPEPADGAAARAKAAAQGLLKPVERTIAAGMSDAEISTLYGRKVSEQEVAAIRKSAPPPVAAPAEQAPAAQATPAAVPAPQPVPEAPAPQPVAEAPPTAPVEPPAAPQAPAQPSAVSEGGIEALDPATIGVDAKRFQFKSGGNEHGVTERLQGVEKWDPRLAGTALVFRDVNGKDWIADGHQRLALAKRLSANQPGIKLNAFVLDAKQGMTEAAARAIAGVKNIAEGTGTSIDAAKVLRAAAESGIELPPLPPRSTLVREGKALARLSPEAFGAAVNGVIPASHAAIIGRLVADPAQQMEAVRVLNATKPENVTQAEMIVKDMLASGTTPETRQGGLFGEESFANSIVLERAKIADEALKQLRKDKNAFRTLVDEAERIHGVGENVLDQQANVGRLTADEKATESLTSLAFHAGPVSDALSAVARRLKAGELKPGEAAREFIGAVRSAIEGRLDARPNAGSVEPGAAGEREGQPAPVETELFQEKQPEEPGAEGLPQLVIPGAEALTREEAARQVRSERQRAEAALRARQSMMRKGGQAPVEEQAGGLFADRAQRELFQPAKKGSITLAEGRRPIIKMFAEADASTLIHEVGHQWLEELRRDAAHPAASDQIIADARTAERWIGAEKDAPLKTAQHEKFARGFEQYMREGVAPSSALARVFAQFKSWLTSIYQTIKGLGAPISDDIRGVFDRLLAEEPQRTVVAPEREANVSLAAIHAADAAEAHPSEAHGIGDRIAAERDRYLADQPPEVQNEIAKAEAARQAAAGTEPAGESGAGGGGQPEVGGGGNEPGPLAPGVGGGDERGAVVEGGGPRVEEGAGVSGGTGGAGREEPGAGLRSQRPGASENARPQPLAPEPANRFDARESPLVDKAGNIRIDNLTNLTEVAQAIRDAANANNDFIGDRRGVITDGQVLDLADALGMDAAQLSQRRLGEAFNAEQVVAARKLLLQSATTTADAMKKAAAGTDEDVLEYARAKARHQMIQAQVAGLTAEAGRALRAFRSLIGETQAAGVDQFLRTATARTLFQLRAEAKLGSLLGDPESVSKFVRDSRKRGFWDMLLEYWINGLISGPTTHITYSVGNTILALEKAVPETGVAALIGAARRAGGRTGEVVHLGEVREQLAAAGRSIPSALKAAVDAFRTGVTTLLPGEKVRALPFQPNTSGVPGAAIDEAFRYSDLGSGLFGAARGIRDGIISTGTLIGAGGEPGAPLLGLNYSPLGAIPDVAIHGVPILPVGTLARLPSRFIAAIHSFFRTVNYSMAKNAMVFRQAAEEGLQGPAFEARVADLRQNPAPETMAAARTIATDLTLMGKGSAFVQALSRLTNTRILGMPILKFIDPFVHIGGNIIDQSIVQRTPVGLLSREIRADIMGKNGNIAQDMAMARMLVGTGLSVAFGTLAGEGLVSGSGPSDPNKAAVWRLAGNQAHSIKIGNTWYQMNRLGPLGMLASISADMYDVAHAAIEGDLQTAGAALMHGFTQNVLDESFMRGPAQLMQAVEDPGRYGQSYIRNFIASFVPYSVGLAQLARQSDPYSRQARTIMDAIKNKVPGLSETLLPRRDIWGEPLPNLRGIGDFTAIYMQKVNNDPTTQALLRNNYFPAAVDKKVRGVTLTPQEYDDYARLAGRLAKHQLDVIVRSPDWQTLSLEAKHDTLQEQFRQAREAAIGVLMAKYPHIPRDATAAKLAPLRAGTK